MGLSDAAIAGILRPFLSGVFLEDRLETSARFFHLVWRSMVRGSLCLPAEGIGAVPAQLADGLPDGVLRLGTPVAEITDAGVLLGDGGEVPARVVVVATDPATAAGLLPDLTVPDTRTVTTYYHATDSPPTAEPILMVDSTGAILNTCVLSQVAPTYAPPAPGWSPLPYWARTRPAGHRRCSGGWPSCTAPTRAAGSRSRPARSTAHCRRCFPLAAEPHHPHRPRPVRVRRPPGDRLRTGRAGLGYARGAGGTGRPGTAEVRPMTKSCPAASTDGLGPEAMATGRTRRPYEG